MANIFNVIRDALTSGTLTHTTLADNSGILLDIHGGKVLTLNTTGEILVQAISNGASSTEELAQFLVKTHGIGKDVALTDSAEFLEQLAEQLAIS